MLINMKVGMELCGDDSELYFMVLREFYKTSKDKQQIIKKYLADSDMKGYAIEVHATKGLAANIGAEELRAKAYEHEMKSKADDAAFCAADFDNLLNLWNQVLSEIEDIVDISEGGCETEAVETNGQSIDGDTLRTKLTTAKDFLDDYEDEDALEIIKELLTYELPSEQKEKLTKICELIDDLEYKQASGVIENFF